MCRERAKEERDGFQRTPITFCFTFALFLSDSWHPPLSLTYDVISAILGTLSKLPPPTNETNHRQDLKRDHRIAEGRA